MSIRTKIALALAFLFTVIVGLVLVGSYYLNQLAGDSREIIKDNYRTLSYVREMSSSLHNISSAYVPEGDTLLVATDAPLRQALQRFRENFRQQATNLTEVSEQSLTEDLQDDFAAIEQLTHDTIGAADYFGRLLPLINAADQGLNSIYLLNEESILHKNEVAQATASNVITYMAVIGVVCTVVGLAFLIGFPGYVANPLRKLTASIQQIAQRNYDERLNFSSQDEFGTLATSFNTMAEQLSEYESTNLAQILYEKKRTETVIRNMREAIVGLDADKKILFANPAAQRLLGLDESELVNQYAPDLASVNDLMRHLIQELMTTSASPATEKASAPIKIVEDSKEQYYTKEVSEVVINEGQQSRIGHVIILKNITSFKELDLAKTNFIATISHELKTPISSIKMSIKLLGDERVGPVTPAQRELVQSIDEDSDRLLKITKELLDLSQVESGNIHLTTSPVAAREIVDYALKSVRNPAQQKNVTLSVNVPDTLPLVRADLEKSAWVLVNLLSNAVRYSPTDRTVTINVRDDAAVVAFSVRDGGKGISPEFQTRIFDKYFQTPNSEKTGSGLGLAISKEFITEQGGAIWVDSTLGEGSTFTFTLPKVKDA